MPVTATPVATRYTHEFVSKWLPANASSVLEVGCGSGELAARLIEDGLQVVAIDADVECVATTRKQGVDARLLTWPARLDQQFDAVLFTRSLHHVRDLEESLAVARQVLRPGGRLIVEDFRAEGGSERSNAWYRGLTRTLAASGAFVDGFDLDDRLSAPEPDHGHKLHSSSAIDEALQCFGRVVSEDAAYYFRYLEAHFQKSEAAEPLLEHEIFLFLAGSIDAMGKRFVTEIGTRARQ